MASWTPLAGDEWPGVWVGGSSTHPFGYYFLNRKYIDYFLHFNIILYYFQI